MNTTRVRQDRRYFTVTDSKDHAILRGQEGRRWHGADTWSLPIGARADRIAKRLGLEVEPAVEAPLVRPPTLDPTYWEEFREYQQRGVVSMRPRTHFLLWDEPGLGKTRQAIGWAAGHNAVVVCPLGVVEQWVKELDKSKVAGSCYTVKQNGKMVCRWGEGHTPLWIVTNYERSSKLNLEGSYRLIVDEATYIKSDKTRRTKEVLRLGEQATGVLALTGHPMVNRPIDLWPLYLLLKQRLKKEFWSWVNTYCGASQTPYGWDFSGATHLADLRDDLAGFGLRREAKDVLPELPDYVELDLQIPEPELEEIEVALKDVLDLVKMGQALDYGEGYATTQRLRMACAASKIAFAGQWLEQHFAGGGKKVVVFCSFKPPLHALAKLVPGMVVVDGDVGEAERERLKEAFENDPHTKVLGLTYGVGALGLNLQHANTMIRLDFPWTPLEYDQSIKRLVRFGQKDNVQCINLLSGHPIETQMGTSLQFKQEIVDAIKTYAEQLFLKEGEL